MASSSDTAGRLMDVATISRELGVSRTVAEKIHRQLPKVTVPGVRKVYVERSDLERLLAENKVAA